MPLPYENSFNQYNNLYNHETFIGICSEYGVSNDLKKWRNQKYFSTWQSRAWETGKPGMSYINENSFSRWLIDKSDGLTTLGLQKLSESVRDYAYLILTSQTSTRAQIIGHEARNIDAQRVFLNTFENIVNRRVNIPEDIRRFQKTLQYAWSKVDYVIGEFIYMLLRDMNNMSDMSANFPSSCDRAFNLFFIHSLAPLFLSLVVVFCAVEVDMLGHPNRASIRTPRVIPKAVKIETIVIPCSLKSVLILSPSVPVSLSKNFMIDSLI